jgi:hypothetical protein
LKTALAITTLLALGAAPALAQPAGDPGAEERARVLYAKGTKHYALAEYDEAIAAFKDAYKELEEPLFLYNIAQAYRQKGDCLNAVRFYKTYLRGESEGETAEQARKFVGELELCAKEREKPAGGTGTGTGTGYGGQGTADGAQGTGDGAQGTGDGAQGTGDGGTGDGGTGDGTSGTGTGTGTGREDVGVVDRGKTKRIVGMAVGGVGVVLFGLGVVNGIKAGNTADELASTCTTAEPCEPDQWRTIHDRGNAQQTNQVLGIAAGTALVTAGVGIYLWGRSSRAERTTVSVTPTRDGAAATLRLAF